MSNEQSTTIRLNDDELSLIRQALTALGSTEFNRYRDQERDEDVRNTAYNRWNRLMTLGSKVGNVHEALTVKRDQARLIEWIEARQKQYYLGFGNFYQVRFGYFGNSVMAEIITTTYDGTTSEEVVVKRLIDSDSEKLAKAVIKFAKSN